MDKEGAKQKRIHSVAAGIVYASNMKLAGAPPREALEALKRVRASADISKTDKNK